MRRTLFIFLTIIAGITLISCGNGSKSADNKDLKTIENLKTAIRSEVTSSAKYLEFSTKAEDEGFVQISKLFAAISLSERVHAANHTRVLSDMGDKIEDFKPVFEVKSTSENVADAVKGEVFETSALFPDFIKVAKEEKISKADESFSYSYQSEKKHLVLFKNALKAMETKNFSNVKKVYFICPKCGNTFDDPSVTICELCDKGKDKFYVVD